MSDEFKVIGPDDVWTPESGGRYELLPGEYNAICIRKPTDDWMIRAREVGTVIVRPKPPYMCGVYCDDRYVCRNVSIEGLHVEGAQVDGIRFMHGVNIKLRLCRVADCFGQGIALHYCENVEVTRSTVYRNGYGHTGKPRQAHGLYASGRNLTITECLFEGNAGWGVHLWADASRCVVARNRILRHPHGSAIVIKRDSHDAEGANLIEGNVIDTALNGVQLVGGGFDRVLNNRIGRVTWVINLQQCPVAIFAAGNPGGFKNYDPDQRIVGQA